MLLRLNVTTECCLENGTHCGDDHDHMSSTAEGLCIYSVIAHYSQTSQDCTTVANTVHVISRLLRHALVLYYTATCNTTSGLS